MSEELGFFANRPEQGEIAMEPLTHFQEDVLADLLQSIHLKSTLYCRAKMSAPWGFRVSSREVASFHIVTGGTCWLTLEGIDKPVLLGEGDLVILPHGHAHTMTDHPDTPVTRLEELVPTQPVERDGIFYSVGSGAVTTLVCGGLQLEDQMTNPLFSLLPTFIHIGNKRDQSNSWLSAIVKLVKVEASVNRPAAETVITRLSEILFIQAVRSCISATSDGNASWFGALKDPQVGQALVLLQRQPGEPWTVESLASRVGLSRSAFSARFKQLVGEPPMQYLTHVRLTKAAAALRTQPATLVEVALSIGYDSEVAFSKAFKRNYGMAPGAYRQGRRSFIGDDTHQNGFQVNGQTRASSAEFGASPLLPRRET
jgi:AraC-like DNA-binding protein/mannose-6-phosphate isomerase-like protein (cupin superfamily)